MYFSLSSPLLAVSFHNEKELAYEITILAAGLFHVSISTIEVVDRFY
jgi:hypothetical protein